MGSRVASVERKTKETDISVRLDLDGSGKVDAADIIILRKYLLGIIEL